MVSGLFVALEGIDGAGTSTQMATLAAAVRARGREVLVTAEPSAGPLGQILRRALGGTPPLGEAALALLFAADRLEHLQHELEPALARGAVVLCDRYVLSSLAYQGCALPRHFVRQINARARAPDVVLYFEVTARTAASRRAARGGRVERFDDEARQARVAAGYRREVRALTRRRHLDATAPGSAHGAATAGQHGVAPASAQGDAPATAPGDAAVTTHGDAPVTTHGDAPGTTHGAAPHALRPAVHTIDAERPVADVAAQLLAALAPHLEGQRP